MWRPILPRLRAWLRAEGAPQPAAPRWLVAAAYSWFDRMDPRVGFILLDVRIAEP